MIILDEIVAHRVETARYAANVLGHDAGGDADLLPVVLLHGNCSSSHFFQPLMQRLRGRSIAIDLRGFGESDARIVDASRGLRDFSDDVAAVLDTLSIERAVVSGWSMGAGVAMQLLIDRPELVAGLLLESPVSPYGFGGTRLDGTLLTDDGAGTGGGGANPDFVARLEAGDASADEGTSPRAVFRSSYVAPGYTVPAELEDLWVASMLSTTTGNEHYPGDAAPSSNWPGFAAGSWGVLNTMAPTHCRIDGFVDLPVAQKPPIAWVRGTADAIVSDESFYDFNTLGKHGIVPGWPGDDVAPPQPMVSQMRRVLEAYAAAGGRFAEHAWEGVGHSPHLEREEDFAAVVEGLRDDARP